MYVLMIVCLRGSSLCSPGLRKPTFTEAFSKTPFPSGLQWGSASGRGDCWRLEEREDRVFTPPFVSARLGFGSGCFLLLLVDVAGGQSLSHGDASQQVLAVSFPFPAPSGQVIIASH